jgi:hypothetical protein
MDAAVTDLKTKLDRFEIDAAECELMALLTMHVHKRQLYSQAALHYRELAADISRALASKKAA